MKKRKNSQLPNPNSQVTSNSQGPSLVCEEKPVYGGGRQRPFDIKERTFLFADEILDLCDSVARKPSTAKIVDQLCGSCTSIGANVEEADGAVTKADRRNKLVIARKEARETRFWLRLLRKRHDDQATVDMHIKEATEILNILSAMISKM